MTNLLDLKLLYEFENTCVNTYSKVNFEDMNVVINIKLFYEEF